MGDYPLGNLRKEIGSRFREIRKDKNFTLINMADMLGTSPSFLSEIENGKKFPSIKILHQLAQKLSISLDYVINNTIKSDYLVPFIDEPDKYYTIKNFDKHIFDFYSPNSIFCFQARDNNMVLEGITKDTVVLVTRTNEINSGNIVVVRYKDDLLLRKYYRTYDKTIFCTETIENNSHTIFENSDHEIMGKVLGVIRYF